VEDVDLVVFTHLHVDHVGWALADGEPFFPRARYVAHSAEFDYFGTTAADVLEIRDDLIELRRAGRVEAVDGGGEVHPGVVIRPLPGHTPGHCGVEVKDVDEGLVDFPALRRGETVLLCWRLGEDEIGYWHTAEDGFDGRRPLPLDDD